MQVGERGPNTEGDEKSAYNNVQVGGAPQHREFRKEILQTMQVGDQRNKFYENIISIPLLRITT
ncbi:nitrogen regulation protein NIFR3 [Staphylococcus aureus]|nr:nitrogen regulation protein NIFR3 [Staphylococcus aureus]